MNNEIASADAPSLAPETAGIVEAIRSLSGERKLASLSALQSQFPDQDILLHLEESKAADVKKMSGSTEVYFFSDVSMTEAYAIHLYRIEERDPIKLIADTVRDDSRIYPRPTPLATFCEQPFRMSQEDLDGAILTMESRPECADIRISTASNGARHLYSSRYLSEQYADSLTEWYEVGIRENP